jgi:membrane complex biogenesis BtpA family protein
MAKNVTSKKTLPDQPAILGKFKGGPRLIAMVHVHATPGTVRSTHSIPELARLAAAEAKVLVRAGFTALLLENMHDAPYVAGPHDPALTVTMTAAALAVREAVGDDVMLGIQILARGEREALSVALVSNAAFIRCENFVFAHVADEGLMIDASAGPLLRYRRNINAGHIAVFADLKKKHAAHAITADVNLADTVHGAEFFGADGIVVTGAATGQPTSMNDVKLARGATSLPVFVGSGVNATSVKDTLRYAHAAIVGSALKTGGHWSAPLDERACAAVVEAAR